MHRTFTPTIQPHTTRQPASMLLLAMLLTFLTFATIAIRPATPANAATIPLGTETSLGPAFNEKTLSPQTAHGIGTDGRSLTYFITSGNTEIGALFQAIDTLTGNITFQQRVPNGIDSWAIATTGNTVIFTANTTNAHLYTWTPGQTKITNLGTPFGTDSIWSMTSAPDGTIYAGSYPTGKLWQVNPTTGTATVIAIPNPGESYIKSLAADDQHIYAGSLGTGKLAQVDRTTKTITHITLPTPPTGTNNTIADLDIRGHHLAIVSPSAPALYLYNTRTSTFTRTVEVDGTGKRLPATTAITRVNSVTSPIHPTDNTLYFQRANFGLAKLDLDTLEYTRTGYSTQSSPRDMFWLNTKLPDWANPSLIVTGATGTTWAYDTSILNLSTRPGRQLDLNPQVHGAPGEIRSLGTGPDGRIYIGGFQNPTGVRVYDPTTNKYSELAGLPQIEGFGTSSSKLLMGGYPRAQLLTYNPTNPTTYTGAKDNFTLNPSIHELGAAQERPFDFADLGNGTVAVASVSEKSTAGGALTIWKPNTSTKQVYRNPIPNQSVVSLETINNHIIAGSSINGGTGYTTTETKAKLFTINPDTGKVISSITPSPEGRVPWVNGLSIDPTNQTIWGIAGRVLFNADIAQDGTITILKQQMMFDNNPGFYGNDFSTFVRDGIIYATSDGNLYAINPLTFEKTTLATGGITDMVVVGNRDLYYAKNNLELFRYRLPAQTTVATPVLGSHTQTDIYNPGATTFTGTSTPGSTITLTAAGTTVTTTTNPDGHWTTPAIHIPAGNHQVNLHATLNNTNSPTITTTIQFAAPISTPKITSHLPGKDYPAGKVSLHGTGTRDSTITLTIAGQTVKTPVYSSGMWFAPAIQIPAGTQQATLAAGKDGYTTPQTTTTLTFVNNITLPTLTTPAVGSTTPAGTVTLSGTADPFSQVTVTAGGRTLTVPTYSSGMWFAKGIIMPTGNQAVIMTATLNGISSPPVRTVRYFTTSTTEQPALTSPPAGSTTPAGMISFYGTATKGATITVTVDGQTVTTPPTYSSGMWFAPPLQVGDGVKKITLTSTLNGQTSTPVTVERTFTSPVKTPTLTSPAAGTTTPAGKVSFYGTSTPGATITLTANGQTVTALTYSSGMWFAPPVSMPAGNHQITMTATLKTFTSPTTTTTRSFR